MVFTDGSSKIAYQLLTGGYGVWYGEGDECNRSFVLDRDEEQTNNTGELRAAFYALSRQPAGKQGSEVPSLGTFSGTLSGKWAKVGKMGENGGK